MPEFAFFTLAPAPAAPVQPLSLQGMETDTHDSANHANSDFAALLQQASQQQQEDGAKPAVKADETVQEGSQEQQLHTAEEQATEIVGTSEPADIADAGESKDGDQKENRSDKELVDAKTKDNLTDATKISEEISKKGQQVENSGDLLANSAIKSNESAPQKESAKEALLPEAKKAEKNLKQTAPQKQQNHSFVTQDEQQEHLTKKKVQAEVQKSSKQEGQQTTQTSPTSTTDTATDTVAHKTSSINKEAPALSMQQVEAEEKAHPGARMAEASKIAETTKNANPTKKTAKTALLSPQQEETKRVLNKENTASIAAATQEAPLPSPTQGSVIKQDSSQLSISMSEQQRVYSETLSSQSIKQTETILARLQKIVATGEETETAAISVARNKTSTTIAMDDMATLRKDGQLPLTETQIMAQKEVSLKKTDSTAKLFAILDENFTRDSAALQEPAVSKMPKELPGTSIDKIQQHPAATTRSEETGGILRGLQEKDMVQGKAEALVNNTSSKRDIARGLTREESIATVLAQTAGNEKENKSEPESGKNTATSRTAIAASSEQTPFSADTSNSGSLFGGQAAQPGIVETPTTPAPTITLPSGVVVREDEIVRQFIDRFQINGRNLESRINIKLNPAELGEIKIALAVKEKSIKANVVAQSQITQKILEKHLGKLKNMLESQGFTIDAINISSSDEAQAEFNLFEQEFKRKQQNGQNRKTSTTAPDQEETEQQTEQEDSINLMV